jgi:hypothetical protein
MVTAKIKMVDEYPQQVESDLLLITFGVRNQGDFIGNVQIISCVFDALTGLNATHLHKSNILVGLRFDLSLTPN